MVKKTVTRKRFLLAFFLVPLGLGGCSENRVDVENRTSQTLGKVSLATSRMDIWQGELEPGENITKCFSTRGDDHIVLRVEFADGESVEGEYGYLTQYAGSSSKFVVGEDEPIRFAHKSHWYLHFAPLCGLW